MWFTQEVVGACLVTAGDGSGRLRPAEHDDGEVGELAEGADGGNKIVTFGKVGVVVAENKARGGGTRRCP